jgi:hypothetical protein
VPTNQSAYRWRHDDGNETAANWRFNENIRMPLAVPGKTLRLRIEVEETGSTNVQLTGQLMVSKNGGTYQAVTTSSTIVKAVDSPNLTDAANTTNQLASSSKTFIAGRVCETGDTANLTLNNNHLEHEYVIQIVDADVAPGDVLDLRINNVGTYTQTPRVTVQKLPLLQTFDHGTSGVTMDEINTAGGTNIGFTQIKGTPTNVAEFSNAQAVSGSLSAHMATLGVSPAIGMSWGGTSATDEYGYYHFRMDSLPPAGDTPITYTEGPPSGAPRIWEIRIKTDGRVELANGEIGVGGTIVATSGAALSPNTWYRFEYHVVFDNVGSTGVLHLRIFAGTTNTLVTELQATGLTTPYGVAQNIVFGPTAVVQSWSTYFDSIGVGTTGFLTTIAVISDSGTALLGLQPSGTEVQARELTDSGTVGLALTVSGTDVLAGGGTAYTESGTALLDLQPAGVETREIPDAGTVGFKLTPSGTDELLFGRMSPGATTAGSSANTKRCSIFTVPQSGAITKVRVYLSNVGNADANAKAIVYADSATLPTTLMGISDEVVVPNNMSPGWVEFPFSTPVNITPGSIWIGYHNDTTITNIYVDALTGGRIISSDIYSDGPTDPFGSGTKFDQIMSVQAVYNTGAGVFTDTGTVDFVLTPSGTDVLSGGGTIYTDSATGFLDLQASAVEVAQRVDAATAALRFTASGVEAGKMFARPASDVSSGSWTVAPLYQKIDEVTADDADYITSGTVSGTADICKIRLNPVVPPDTNVGQTVRYRYGKLGTDTASLRVRLMRADGTTEIASQLHTNIAAGPVEASFELSPAQVDSIPTADFGTGLVLQLEATS